MTTNAQVIAEIFTTLENQLAALRNCDNNDFILAFDNGIGIRFVDGKPTTCTLDKAGQVAHEDMPEEAWGYIPVVKNGAGEKAKLVRRQAAMKAEIANIEATIADLRLAA